MKLLEGNAFTVVCLFVHKRVGLVSKHASLEKRGIGRPYHTLIAWRGLLIGVHSYTSPNTVGFGKQAGGMHSTTFLFTEYWELYTLIMLS